MNILFHQGALGDWILTFPILRGLGDQHGPTLAVAPRSKAQLASRLFDHVESCDIEQADCSMLHAKDGASGVSRAGCRRLAGAELIISFVSLGLDAWAEQVRELAPNARIAFIDPRLPPECDRHVCQWVDLQLVRQGIVLKADAIEPRKNPNGPIVIHPGSGGRRKCWPITRFEQLAKTLGRQGHVVFMLLGEVEIDTWPSSLVNHLTEDFAAQQIDSLIDLCRILEGARLYIGNDSGPTHLAAALGIKTIALFGPTNADQWSPIGPDVTIVAPPPGHPTLVGRTTLDMDWLDGETVLDAVK